MIRLSLLIIVIQCLTSSCFEKKKEQHLGVQTIITSKPKEDAFHKFLNEINNKREIDKEYIMKFLEGDTIYQGLDYILYGERVLNWYDSIEVIVVCRQFGYVDNYYEVVTFSSDGKFLKSYQIGYYNEGYKGIDTKKEERFTFLANHIIETRSIEKKNINDSLNYKESIGYRYCKIEPNGKIVTLSNNTTNEHDEFNQISHRIIRSSDIQNYTIVQLRILRNSIFAFHGYKFKSPDLKEYFNQKEWYKPRYDDVTDNLTDIEKLNIQIIMKREEELKKK